MSTNDGCQDGQVLEFQYSVTSTDTSHVESQQLTFYVSMSYDPECGVPAIPQLPAILAGG